MQISRFSRDSRLPCEIKEITTNVLKRKLNVKPEDKIGLTKKVLAIPLNQGFILCTKEAILYVDEISQLHQLDGNHTFTDLSTKQGIQSTLEQLFYYDLLSFSSHNGYLKEVKVDPLYTTQYLSEESVLFSMIPLAVELNITNTCNFNCIHCSKNSKSLKFPDELSTEEILAIIDECLESGVPELRFMGGEPLIHPGFLKFIRRAKEKGVFQLKLSTNGWLIDDNMAKELARCFDSIQLSVHGASPNVHDHVVGKKGAWEQAKTAAKLLNKNGVKVNIGFAVMRDNVNDIPKMPHLASEWEVDSLGFLCLIPQGRGVQLKSWSVKEIMDMRNTIKQIKCEFGHCLNLDVAGFPPINPLMGNNTIYGCEAGKTFMVVNPNGTVKSCGILNEDLGLNIKEKKLLDIWHSPQFARMRKRQNCEDCNYTQICWGPCKFLETQEYPTR